MDRPDQPLSRGAVLAWILCLGALAVGARNFEESLSIDAPLYASIARHIVRSGEWFRLHGGVPDFDPFFEHPHLGFWLVACVFKVLPAADWSARIVGHVFYVAFLVLFFHWVRARSGERVAIWSTLIFWAWDRVSTFFSSVYLDPAALFFGTSALFLLDKKEAPRRIQVAAGALLGLCVMTKGLTVLGFLPAAALLFWLGGKPRTEILHRLAATALGFFAVLAGYVLALKLSAVPNFASLYFGRQLTGRLTDEWFFARFFKLSLWHRVFRDSHYLAPLALLAIPKLLRDRALWVPTALFSAFLAMYGCAGLGGNQYWITVFPWLGWLIAAGALSRIPWHPRPLVVGSAGFALAVLFVLQYIPVRLHGKPPAADIEALRDLKRAGGIDRLYVDAHPQASHFGLSSGYAWYVDVPVLYPKVDVPPAATAKTGYLLLTASPARETQLGQAGFCPVSRFGERAIWQACPRPSRGDAPQR